IPSSDGFHVTYLRNDMGRPFAVRPHVLVPTQFFAKPASRDEIHTTVFIDIEWNGSEVIEVLAICGLLSKSVAFSEDGAGVVAVEVEKIARNNIGLTVIVHIKHTDRFE